MALAAHRSLQSRLQAALQRNVALAGRAARPSRQLATLLQLLRGNERERPSQALLLHLAHYLALLIEPRASRMLEPWPPPDRPAERAFKTQLLTFLSAYCGEDCSLRDDKWVTPIQFSYLVNAAGFKVVQLLFEMSQVALRKVLRSRLAPKDERLQVTDLSRYVNAEDDLHKNMRIVKERLQMKVNYLRQYRKVATSIVEQYKTLLDELQEENKAKNLLLSRCIDEFPLRSRCESELNDLKIVNYSAIFLQYWWDLSDDILTEAENAWASRNQAFLDSTKLCKEVSEATVRRNTLKDNSSHTIEYCPNKDKVSIEKLESQVSSQQRYILKNIAKDNILNFPNLLRSYAVAICFFFKNVRCVGPMGEFNNCLGVMAATCDGLVGKSKALLDDMHGLDLKLQEQENTCKPTPMDEDYNTIEMAVPPLPDLRFRDEAQHPVFDKCFTPLNMSKIQFSIRNFVPTEFKQPRSLFQVPTQSVTRATFSKNMAKLYSDDSHTTAVLNTSKISLPAAHALNETTDRSAVFTKQQINRLLSCRKTSSSKKMRSVNKSSHGNAKRSCLFSKTPDNSFALIRSHSSPDLCPASDMKKRLPQNYLARNLYAITQEESPDKLEISGITHLRSNTNCTPQTPLNADFTSMPLISISKPEMKHDKEPSLKNCSRLDSMVDMLISQPSYEANASAITVRTPQNFVASEKKKSKSIDKLLERFRMVSQNTRGLKMEGAPPALSLIEDDLFHDKKFNQIFVNTSFSPRLPDLLSPSCNVVPKASPVAPESDALTPEPKGYFKSRESLGTALGVDISFLDQNDLVVPE